MKKPQGLSFGREDGFLLKLTYILTDAWVHYLAVWSWVGVFHHMAPKQPGDRVWGRIIQNNVLHDICWMVRPVVAVAALAFWDAVPPLGLETRKWQLSLGALAAWSALDFFISLIHGTIFGFKNRPGQTETMTTKRAQRRLMLTLTDFITVICLYATLYLTLSHYLGSGCANAKFEYAVPNPELDKHLDVKGAFHLAMATITTLGYGNYAPISVWAVTVCLMEAITGLLMIGGSIAQMATLLKVGQASPTGGPEGNRDDLPEPPEGKEIEGWQYVLRWFLPPIGTGGSLLGLYWLMAHFS